MGSLRNNSNAVYVDQQDKKIAWADYLRRLEVSGMSVGKFVAENPVLVLDTGIERIVTPTQVYYARKNRTEDGGYCDRRHDNKGRPVSLSNYCQGLLMENFINFPKWSAKAHHEILLECINHDPRLDQKKVALARKPTYRQSQRFLKALPPLLKVFAEGGVKEVQEKFGPCQPMPNYVPGQMYVADTVTLKNLCFIKDGKPQSPQVTFLMDAASRYCVWAILHWEDATSETFITLLQQALVRNRCPKQSDAWLQVGCPVILLTDNGSIFKNKDVARFCHLLNIYKEFSYPYCPRNNGQAEAFSKKVACGFSPFLEMLAVKEGLFGQSATSERTTIFIERFYSLIVKYNQTPKECLGGLSPLEYFERNRPHMQLNPHSAAEIIQASRLYTHVTLSKGSFPYDSETYYLEGLKYMTGKVKIWYDPGILQPTKIEVERKGKFLGIATNKRPDGSGLTSRPSRSRGVTFILPGTGKFPKRRGTRSTGRVKGRRVREKVVVATSEVPSSPVAPQTATPTLELKALPSWAKGGQ